MPDQGRRSPLRILAPLALAVFALAFFAILLSSGGGDGDAPEKTAGTERGSTRTTKQRERETTTTAPRTRQSVYKVKVGDTLGDISQETGVPVERLLELNPGLDPQALVAGQEIKLRE